MLYEVKYFDYGEIEVEFTLFRSHSVLDCWDFVRNHLTCKVTRDKAKQYVVTDTLGHFYDPSIDVIHLKRAA